MAAKTKEAVAEPKSPKLKDIFSNFLDEHKDSHFNYHEGVNYKISTGSLKLDKAIDGGFFSGIENFAGSSEGGKTSCALDTVNNGLDTVPNSKGLYIKCEGRLSKAMMAKSKHKFVFKTEEWVEGTIFVLKSNIYETVAAFIDLMISNNPNNYKYFIILDSLDGLVLRGDLAKSFDGDESVKVAGAPLMTKRILKQCSLPISESGHLMILISQVSASITGKYDVPDQLRGNGGGGNAKVHFCDYILEFMPRTNQDLILEGNDTKLEADVEVSNQLGHYCKVRIRKSANEKTNLIARYPIRYGVKEGSSIWTEYEIFDLLEVFKLVEKGGSWYTIKEATQNILRERGVSEEVIISNKFQGRNNLLNWISNAEVKKALFEYMREILNEEF